MAGSVGRRREWLSHPEEIIGKQVTFRYQELSAENVPRFPRGVEVRDYE